jgi:hypothetical protein
MRPSSIIQPRPPPPANNHRLEELELSLAALATVNKHLNSEVEALTHALAGAECERDAWQARARKLASQLANERRQSGAQASTSGKGQDAAPAQTAEEVLAAAVVAVPVAAPMPEWSQCQEVVGQLVDRAQAGGWLIRSHEVRA